jgi:hypothetical protein
MVFVFGAILAGLAALLIAVRRQKLEPATHRPLIRVDRPG